MGLWLIFPASEIVIASHLAANRTGSGSRPGRTLDFGVARIPGSLASADETGSSNTNHSAKRSNSMKRKGELRNGCRSSLDHRFEA